MKYVYASRSKTLGFFDIKTRIFWKIYINSYLFFRIECTKVVPMIVFIDSVWLELLVNLILWIWTPLCKISLFLNLCYLQTKMWNLTCGFKTHSMVGWLSFEFLQIKVVLSFEFILIYSGNVILINPDS